jgi:ABC-type transporter Mla subunit MlaD
VVEDHRKWAETAPFLTEQQRSFMLSNVEHYKKSESGAAAMCFASHTIQALQKTCEELAKGSDASMVQMPRARAEAMRRAGIDALDLIAQTQPELVEALSRARSVATQLEQIQNRAERTLRSVDDDLAGPSFVAASQASS